MFVVIHRKDEGQQTSGWTPQTNRNSQKGRRTTNKWLDPSNKQEFTERTKDNKQVVGPLKQTGIHRKDEGQLATYC
jgi:hypothetical protein